MFPADGAHLDLAGHLGRRHRRAALRPDARPQQRLRDRRQRQRRRLHRAAGLHGDARPAVPRRRRQRAGGRHVAAHPGRVPQGLHAQHRGHQLGRPALHRRYRQQARARADHPLLRLRALRTHRHQAQHGPDPPLPAAVEARQRRQVRLRHLRRPHRPGHRQPDVLRPRPDLHARRRDGPRAGVRSLERRHAHLGRHQPRGRPRRQRGLLRAGHPRRRRDRRHQVRGGTVRAALLAVLLAAPARAAYNADAAGTAGGQFLKLGGDARGAAMGQAMTAASEDASALYYNPAGLSQVRQRNGTATQGFLYQDVSVSFAAYAHPVLPAVRPRRRFLRPSGLGTLAVGLLYLNAGGIGEVDNTGAATGGTFTPRDVAAMAGWGATLTDMFDLGISLKYVDSRIQAAAKTGSLDVGARMRLDVLGMPYTAALGARNMAGRLRFHDQTDPLPMDVRFGQMLRPIPQWLLSLDLAFPRDNAPYPAFGTEFSVPIEKELTGFMRLGYDGRLSPGDLDGIAGMSVGLGVGIQNWTIDYGWVPYGTLGHTHRFSVSARF
ncbi:PorV/PorQ family protein [bacterium]|nr:MAG: PorV/PorQ family protein [bacterium]